MLLISKFLEFVFQFVAIFINMLQFLKILDRIFAWEYKHSFHNFYYSFWYLFIIFTLFWYFMNWKMWNEIILITISYSSGPTFPQASLGQVYEVFTKWTFFKTTVSKNIPNLYLLIDFIIILISLFSNNRWLITNNLKHHCI